METFFLRILKAHYLYTLTKTITYNEALEILNTRLVNAFDLTVEEILREIPQIKPIKGTVFYLYIFS